MTKKRFTMKGSTILENNEEITAWDCCDLLNELHEENEQLKQQINKLQFNKAKGQQEYQKRIFE